MRDDRRNYVVVGAFVVAVGAALVLWLAVLSGRTGATDRYYVVFDNVLGLAPGTQVLYEGFPIGVIDEIRPVIEEQRRRFRIDLEVRRGWQIPEDSTAGVTASGFLSAVVLDVQGGLSQTALEPGGRIPSAETANVLELVSSVADEIQMLSRDSLRPLIERLAESTPVILDNLERFTRDVNETVARVNELVSPENAARVEHILAGLERTSDNAEALSRDLARTREELEVLLGSARALMETSGGEVEHLVGDLHHSLEIVSQHIDAIARNLEATTRNASEFSLQIRSDPSVVLRGRKREVGDAE